VNGQFGFVPDKICTASDLHLLLKLHCVAESKLLPSQLSQWLTVVVSVAYLKSLVQWIISPVLKILLHKTFCLLFFIHTKDVRSQKFHVESKMQDQWYYKAQKCSQYEKENFHSMCTIQQKQTQS